MVVIQASGELCVCVCVSVQTMNRQDDKVTDSLARYRSARKATESQQSNDRREKQDRKDELTKLGRRNGNLRNRVTYVFVHPNKISRSQNQAAVAFLLPFPFSALSYLALLCLALPYVCH